MDSSCHERTGDIRTAAREGADNAADGLAVEARNDRIGRFSELFAQEHHGLGHLQRAALVEADHICRINERETEILCEQHAVEIFAAACCEISGCALFEAERDPVELIGRIKAQSEILCDLKIAAADLAERLGKILALRGKSLAGVEHIGDFCIFRKALTRRRRHNIAALRIGGDNRLDLFELTGIRKRASAEFDNFAVHLNL